MLFITSSKSTYNITFRAILSTNTDRQTDRHADRQKDGNTEASKHNITKSAGCNYTQYVQIKLSLIIIYLGGYDWLYSLFRSGWVITAGEVYSSRAHIHALGFSREFVLS